jgi:hypothetical protein
VGIFLSVYCDVGVVMTGDRVIFRVVAQCSRKVLTVDLEIHVLSVFVLWIIL